MKNNYEKNPTEGLQEIDHKIYSIRGHQVMLDSDLAILYGVSTKALNQAVRRNLKRFPSDFMFQLIEIEEECLRSQFVTSKSGRGGKRYLPFVFSEQGVAMLSSVLKSERAIQTNIVIMRIFGRLRSTLESNRELSKRLSELERKYDSSFEVVFDAIQALISAGDPPMPKQVKGLGIE